MELTDKSHDQPLKFGLLLNNFTVEAWQFDAIGHLLDSGHLLSVAIIQTVSANPQSFFSRIRQYPWRRFIFRWWHRFLFKPEAKKIVDISDLLEDIPILTVTPIQKGYSQFFPDETIQQLGEMHLDFMLRFGFSILRGDILQSARFGIWSYHHDDERHIRGGPPGFWEVFKADISNGVILQQLTNDLDKGIILARMQLPVIPYSWKAQLNQLYFSSSYLVAQVAYKAQTAQLFPQLSTSDAPVYKAPTNHIMCWYWIKMAWRRLLFHLRTLILQEDWNIGLIEASLPAVTDNPKQYIPQARWLPKEKRYQYLADPFVIEHANETWLFAEKYDYRIGQGKIVAAKASEQYRFFRPALDVESHCSFPFVFIEGGRLFCIPENYVSGMIHIYEWDQQSEQFIFYCQILEGIAAIDPVLYTHNGIWWLLFSRKELASAQLYAYFSTEMKGPYKPHPLNPVKTDIFSSRNAGTPWVKNGRIYRFAQDCAGSYGRMVRMMEMNISSTSFNEKEVTRIMPDDKSPYCRGLHTINGCSQLTVIDGKRYSFSWWGLRHQWLLKVKKR
ncbi:MAG: hypothetical protein M0Q41_04505 [Bacteroidales bacterium]|nr:hypothetical protein [Bacteroidales bacterium]